MPALLKTTQIQEPSSATINLALDTSGGVTVGQNLTVTGNLSVTGTGMTGRLIRAPQVITTTGAGTYTTPSNCTAIYVEVVGGGASGGSNLSPSGGGGGGYAAKYFTVTASTGYSYVVGTAGAGVASGNNGNAGVATTFTVGATTITGGGGSAGVQSTTGQTVGGAGGTATNGDININGGAGGYGYYVGSGMTAIGGGGSTPFGISSPTIFAAFNVANSGAAGSGYGCGGTGANGGTSGAGKAGVIRIWEYT